MNNKKKIAILLAVVVSITSLMPAFALTETVNQDTEQLITLASDSTAGETETIGASGSDAEDNSSEIESSTYVGSGSTAETSVVEQTATTEETEASEETESEYTVYAMGLLDADVDIKDPNEKQGTSKLMLSTPIPLSFPSSFSNAEYFSTVRDQGNRGICWAFSTIASAEIYMHEQGHNETYSEYALAYFTFHGQKNPIGTNVGYNKAGTYGVDTAIWSSEEGSTNYGAVFTLSGGVGATVRNGNTDESKAGSYGNVPAIDASYCYQDKAILTESIFLPDYNSSQKDVMKHAIMEHGGVVIGFRVPYNRNDPSTIKYQNNKNQCFKGSGSANHSVIIVGWDDDYKKENFQNCYSQPDNDGAWIFRNSWGESWGDEGYGYISYEDTSIAQMVVNTYEDVPANSYNYHYDGTSGLGNVTCNTSGGVANVFTIASKNAVCSQKQKLKAVNVVLRGVNQSFKIEVIKLNSNYNGNPKAGTVLDTLIESNEYEGIYTYKLNNPVEVSPGEIISVVVTPTSGKVCLGIDGLDSDCVDYMERGKSYEYSNGMWKDCSLLTTRYTPRIKLFTDVVSESNHVYEYHAAVDSTYTSTGMKAHYTCSSCSNYFDTNRNEVTCSSLVIAKKEHSTSSSDTAISTKTKSSSGGGGGGGGSKKTTTTTGAPTYSSYWKQGADGTWRIYFKSGQLVTTAWLCDDAVSSNGQNVWYLLNPDGTMMSAGLVQDGTGNFYSLETNHDGYFGMLRYKNGYYNCNGQQIYIEFEQTHNGSFGAVKNADALAKLKTIYGITQYGVNNSNCVYTGTF